MNDHVEAKLNQLDACSSKILHAVQNSNEFIKKSKRDKINSRLKQPTKPNGNALVKNCRLLTFLYHHHCHH